MELLKIIENHKLWLTSSGASGERADLRDADLRGADLRGANLRGANLRDANLRDAYLRDADLQNADLQNADLRDANLQNADLRDADLRGANLRGANLRGADLQGADLRDANILDTCAILQCPENGAFIAYKKLRDGVIAELEIPAYAKRGSATSRKCRASAAKCLGLYPSMGEKDYLIQRGVSQHYLDFIYEVGKTYKIENFDPDRFNECAPGIHFFITREEAEAY